MINYLEIRKDGVLAEGSADAEPLESQVAEAIKNRGYLASSININYDSLQNLWRFTAVLKEQTNDRD